MRKRTVTIVSFLALSAVLVSLCGGYLRKQAREAAASLERQMLDEQAKAWLVTFREEAPLFEQAAAELLAADWNQLDFEDSAQLSSGTRSILNRYPFEIIRGGAEGPPRISFTVFAHELDDAAGSSCLYLIYCEDDPLPQYAGIGDGARIAERWFLSKAIWYMDGI